MHVVVAGFGLLGTLGAYNPALYVNIPKDSLSRALQGRCRGIHVGLHVCPSERCPPNKILVSVLSGVNSKGICSERDNVVGKQDGGGKWRFMEEIKNMIVAKQNVV